MNESQAKAKIAELYEVEVCKAHNAVVSFDRMLEKKVKNLQNDFKVPMLVRDGKLNIEAITSLTNQLTSSGFVHIVFDAGVPHVFTVDPFLLKVSLNGTIVEREFIAYYTKKKN